MALKAALITCGVLALAALAVNRLAAAREARAEAAFPPVGQIMQVGDTAVHMTVEGAGPPLVLLHGAGGNLRDFEPLAERLAARYTVVRFDRPGLGYSGLPEPHGPVWRTSAPSPAEQAMLLAAAYRQTGLGPALILGLSYAGTVALSWALEDPDQVAGLVMVSAVSNTWPGGLEPIYGINSSVAGAAVVVPLITAFATDAQAQEVIGTIFEPQDPPAGYDQTLGAPLSTRRGHLRANARQVNTLKAHVEAMVPRYGELTLPVEIVHGEADEIVSLELHSAALATQIEGAHLTRLPGVGHMPHHVAADEVIAAIDRAAARAGLATPGPATTAP